MLKGRIPTFVPVDTFEIWRTYQRKSQKPAVLEDVTSKKYLSTNFFFFWTVRYNSDQIIDCYIDYKHDIFREARGVCGS